MTKSKEKKDVLISFRLTESEYEPYKEILEKTELSKTDFFRGVFLQKQYTFNVQECKPVEYGKLMFIFNKTSNNINQIAKRLNAENKEGIISQRSYNIAINKLIAMQSQLKRMLDAC
jgi:hypothetical protein